jgi:hypothetical protein
LEKAIGNDENRVEKKSDGMWAERERRNLERGLGEALAGTSGSTIAGGVRADNWSEGRLRASGLDFLNALERDPLVVYWRWPRTEGTSRPSPASGMGLEFREIKPHFRTVLERWILAARHQQKKP